MQVATPRQYLNKLFLTKFIQCIFFALTMISFGLFLWIWCLCMRQGITFSNIVASIVKNCFGLQQKRTLLENLIVIYFIVHLLVVLLLDLQFMVNCRPVLFWAIVLVSLCWALFFTCLFFEVHSIIQYYKSILLACFPWAIEFILVIINIVLLRFLAKNGMI